MYITISTKQTLLHTHCMIHIIYTCKLQYPQSTKMYITYVQYMNTCTHNAKSFLIPANSFVMCKKLEESSTFPNFRWVF